MQRNQFGSIFKKSEPSKSVTRPTPPAYQTPEIRTIATLQVGFPEIDQGWVEFHRLDGHYDFFQIKLQLFLTTYAEILFQIADLDEGKQLTDYIRDVTSFMIDSDLSLENRVNILGDQVQLLLAPPNNAPPPNKMTTLLQVTLPGGLVTTDFLFNCDSPHVFLPTCILLILQELIYTLPEHQLKKLLKALQAMDAFYQTVKEPHQPDSRREAPAYALRSIL
jgi:hypothetical protein